MRLTKKRVAALETALSVDDILFERFRRLNDELKKREHAFKESAQVARVYLKEGDHTFRLLCIEEVRFCPGDGLTLIVRV